VTNSIPEQRLERYITALRDADQDAELTPADLIRFAEAAIAVANDETDPVYRSGYTTGYMHAGGAATDTNRRARLFNEISLGGRWKSGDVVAWYERHGLTDLSVRTARQDLATLRDSGALTQHDEKGVRYFTASQKGSRT
jgi:hypothetical protein